MIARLDAGVTEIRLIEALRAALGHHHAHAVDAQTRDLAEISGVAAHHRAGQREGAVGEMLDREVAMERRVSGHELAAETDRDRRTDAGAMRGLGGAGLVIVAIAGNAIENVVGIQLAAKNQADYAVSVILQSPLQVALVLAPLLVLISHFVAPVALTLVFPPLLLAAMILAAVVTVVVMLDGESTWLEGVALIALYFVIAAAVWWG